MSADDNVARPVIYHIVSFYDFKVELNQEQLIQHL